MKNKVICLLVCLCIVLCFTGCYKRELNQRSLVEGIAVDKKGNEFLITVEAYKATEKYSGERNYELYSGRGKTVYSALQNIVTTTGKTPFYSNCRVIIFSFDVLHVQFL